MNQCKRPTLEFYNWSHDWTRPGQKRQEGVRTRPQFLKVLWRLRVHTSPLFPAIHLSISNELLSCLNQRSPLHQSLLMTP